MVSRKYREKIANTLIAGDALDVLRKLPDNFIQACITSPPYYSLRDYGTAEWVGGDAECDHKKNPPAFSKNALAKSTIGAHANTGHAQEGYKDTCLKCGAIRKDQQVGVEKTPDLYIAHLVEIFHEVKRVLRPDGVCFVVIGDSYNNFRTTGYPPQSVHNGKQMGKDPHRVRGVQGIKEKDLMLIPFMLAFALRNDGWYMRQVNIWEKGNATPASVKDRTTTSHEYILHLSKNKNYYYDIDAIREPCVGTDRRKQRLVNGVSSNQGYAHAIADGKATHTRMGIHVNGRNKRSVWSVATVKSGVKHYASYPPKLIEPMVLAGSAQQACEICGAPWERVYEPTGHVNKREPAHVPGNSTTKVDSTGWAPVSRATGTWQPTCNHSCKGTSTSLILDPFCGVATTCLVAAQLGRDFLGIDLSPEYIDLGYERLCKELAKGEKVG